MHGQFGTVYDGSDYPAKSGYAKYIHIDIPQSDHLYLELSYSKWSTSSVPILVYLDGELTPRATFYPADRGDWNQFASTGPINLGSVASGVHSIEFYTDGQEWGVADLDVFTLAFETD